MDPDTAALIRKASLRAFITGFAVAGLIATVVCLVSSGLAGEFRHGAAWGFAIGLGIILGGTVLNVVIGLIDQWKSDVTGS